MSNDAVAQQPADTGADAITPEMYRKIDEIIELSVGEVTSYVNLCRQTERTGAGGK